jgi:uncharacterized protein (DUF1330 family)
MPSYAIGLFSEVRRGPDIAEYIARIDATLQPFGGRFLIHRATAEAVEGAWGGALVVIAFPDREAVRAWYASPAYQAILPLRLAHATGDVCFVDGVPEGYRAAALPEDSLASA